MARCPSCDYPLPEDRERMGSRCPSCKDPLYEPQGRIGRPVRMGEAACTVHPANESLGPCSRCGNFLCEVCRTRWRDQVLCAACVDRALESRDRPLIHCRINPQDKRKIDVCLTPEGSAAFQEYQTARIRGVAALLAKLPEEDLDDLQRLLNRLPDLIGPPRGAQTAETAARTS